jgi:hypothetical protein
VITNQSIEVDAILRRVKRVERTNRVLIALVVLGAISNCLVFRWGPRIPTVSARNAVAENSIEAQRFTLKDAHGSARAILENTDQGPGLTFRSTDGETQAAIKFTSGGLGISWIVEGKPVDLLLINKNLTVGLLDQNATVQMALSLNGENHRFDVKGIGMAGGLSLSSQGNSPTLSLSDSNSSTRAVLRADPFGGRLSLLGNEGNSQVALGVGPDGAPGVSMHGAGDNPNASMLILPGRAAIILTDAQGKRLDLAP